MKQYFNLVTFSHTIFALPFAMVGYFLAVNQAAYQFEWQTLFLVLCCMVFARNAAMAFNRWQDRDIDIQNPRTATREIPSGKIEAKAALYFTVLNAAAFMASAFFINSLCFALSPVALAIVLGYSYMKRFTALCHLVLGLGLSLAPIGGYLAVSGQFDLVPVLYGIAVLFWVAGFDVIYALQDEEFDRSLSLKSIPVSLGGQRALNLSSLFHLVTCGLMLWASVQVHRSMPEAQFFQWIGLLGFFGLLFYQHTLVKPNDLSKVNRAFFTTNGFASLFFGTMLILDLYV